MNAFTHARSVEARALVRLLPFVERQADDGRYVLTDKGRLAPFLQETIGDALMNRDGRIWAIEFKAEETETGNLFLETWSNRNLNDPSDHARLGSNPGWLYKIRADLLFYYFLNTDALYVLNVLALKRWAFGYRLGEQRFVPRIFQHDERQQGKYYQLNDTLGRCVPISILLKQMNPPPKKFSVQQLEIELGSSA